MRLPTLRIWTEDKDFDHPVIREIKPWKAEANLPLFLSVFETIVEAVVITDAAERVIAVNPAFTDITGVGMLPRKRFVAR